jgi:hypothetical protein
MFLEAQEVERLTGKRRRGAQVRALRAMGIEHKVRPDGVVIVLREHVKKVLDSYVANAKLVLEQEPNWSEIE